MYSMPIDAEQVYGSRLQLKPGLKRLSQSTARRIQHCDNATTRIGLERVAAGTAIQRAIRRPWQAVHDAALQQIKIRGGISSGATHPDVLAAESASSTPTKSVRLAQKIMVQGNPVYLAQSPSGIGSACRVTGRCACGRAYGGRWEAATGICSCRAVGWHRPPRARCSGLDLSLQRGRRISFSIVFRLVGRCIALDARCRPVRSGTW